MVARIDFETYSECGYVFDVTHKKWESIAGHGKKSGLPAVGSTVYAQHPSTEILSLAYEIQGTLYLWVPGMQKPIELFKHIASDGLVEAHNVGFEYSIWQYVCHERMGWPRLRYEVLRDTSARARAYGLPGSLGKVGEILGLSQKKDSKGTQLLKKYSVPRQPTARDTRTRVLPEGAALYAYNLQDVVAQREISEKIPDLNATETEFFVNTLACNVRGVGIRPHEVDACINVLDQAYAKYNGEFQALTGISEATKVSQLMQYCNSHGLHLDTLDDEAITNALKGDLADEVRRALEIRQAIGSAGVKKVYTMKRQVSRDNRLTNLFIYHGARTGRDTGADVQPQNLTKAGPKVKWCPSCKLPFGSDIEYVCPHCKESAYNVEAVPWSWQAVDTALEVIGRGSLEEVEKIFGSAVLTVSGCIRGLFVAGPEKDFICSDYSSIEAVVTAVLAGEQWRIDAFRRKEDIYLVSAGRITGKTIEFYQQYQQQTGQKHPDRSKIGKPAELALGFGGWVSAWQNFDKSGTFCEEEIKKNILLWRHSSPCVVELWGGHFRGVPWKSITEEFYGLEGASLQAVLEPGTLRTYRYISYIVENDVLFCILPSGRRISYHKPRISKVIKYDTPQLQLSFEGWNTNPKMGPIGWHRLNTYGGRLTENVVQAVARDIMAHAINQLEKNGYPVVLRVHDEIVSEVPVGKGSIEEFEDIMTTLPDWASGWPIRASGGWRGIRYRKD